VDLSALIFVALAVAWAVYLVPKAIKHHDEVVRSRSVEKFSHTMRVLARREPTSGRNARLVIAPIRAALRPPVETKARAPRPEASAEQARPARPVSPAAARAAARTAARRRRNVLAVIASLNVVVAALAIGQVIAWPWIAAPLALLVAWLVACRVSVKVERRGRVAPPAPRRPAPVEETVDETPAESVAEEPVATEAVAADDTDAAELPGLLSGEIPVVRETVPGAWDMQPTPLPTYVTKPAAQRRTVSTIDLDSTGVWSSGRSELDSALAREADLIAKAEKVIREADERRASGA
jgi:hypothetical protein